MEHFEDRDETLLHQLYEWQHKNLDDIPITELTNLQYILEHLPIGVGYTLKSKRGEFKNIDDYFYQMQDKYFEAMKKIINLK